VSGVPRALALALATAAAAACGRDRTDRDATAAVDSTTFGDDRVQGDTARVVPEVALLERLIDQYEGLDVVMDELAGPTSGSAVRGRASKGDRHEDAAKAQLLDLLASEFGERYQPRTPKAAARTTGSIGSLARDAGRRALDSLVLSHHRRVARTIAEALPTVRNGRVRDVLAGLSDHLRTEIRQLSAELGPGEAR
jgi:hypothetical protein